MRARLALPLFLALVSCGPAAGTSDAGSTNADASIDPATAAAIGASMQALAVAASVGAPLAPSGTMLRGDAAPDTTAHMRAQDGFSGMSVVEPPTCAMYAWSGLTATITMTGCTLEAIGTPVSGGISLTVATRPVTFTVALTALVVNGTTYDGHVTLTLGGTDAMPAAPTLDVDLTTTGASGTLHLTATGLSVTTATTSIAISGTATVMQGGSTTTITATNLTWAMGQCLPSSGAVAMTTGMLTTALVFEDQTPATGVVSVTVPPFPTTMQMLFSPCP